MNNVLRGAAIRRRRIAAGITSTRRFADATGVDRHAVGRAEGGTAAETTYERLEAWLDRYDDESSNDPADESDLVTFQITGNFGVSATVRGPVGNLEELEEAAARLIREMRITNDQ